MAEQLSVHRAGDRFLTRHGQIETWHSFSFGAHYDPANVAFGPLVAFNDERLAPGAGFEPHHHGGIEIVTYVVAGTLSHRSDADASRDATLVAAGGVKRLHSGDGVVHSERNASSEKPLRFLQSWLMAGDSAGPRHVVMQAFMGIEGSWTTLASGSPLSDGVALSVTGASLMVDRLGPGEQVALPEGARRQLFVIAGSASVDVPGASLVLEDGDALRCSTSVEVSLTAGASGVHLLAWVFED